MKACIVGAAGKMGHALIWAMRKLDFEVVAFDLWEKKGVTLELSTLDHVTMKQMLPDKCDVLISAAPFYMNEDFARYCSLKDIRYCDLGGNPDWSAKIQEIARSRESKPVLTDLGLAPGYANIVATGMLKALAAAKPTNLEIRVGGLPAKPEGILKYGRFFSMDGLENEYTGACHVLEGGEETTVEAMTDIDKVHTLYGDFESFHTRGGISTTLQFAKEMGVLECFYKTLRFPGHAQFIQFMQQAGCYSHQFVGLQSSKNAFQYIIKNLCPENPQDFVVIDIKVVCKDQVHTWSNMIKYDNEPRPGMKTPFRAMQKGTSFPTAAAAAVMATGVFDNKPVITYEDIANHDREFRENLAILEM